MSLSGRGRNSRAPVELDFASVFTVEDRVLTRIELFLTLADASRAVELSG